MINRRQQSSGIALIVTLLVIVILTIAVTAFMQSMSLERRTSQAYLNILRADEAVQAGFADATKQITTFKLTNPYYAIGYKTVATQMTPYIIGNADYNTDPTTTPATNEVRLVSGNPTTTTTLTNSNSTEMNMRRSSSDQYGWMGSPIVSGAPVYRSQRALWIKLLQNGTLPEQPNPGVANYNPVIARYAFWVDDETCKLDVGVDGNSAGATNRFSRSATGALVSDLDLSALPLLNKTPLPDDAMGGTILKNITDFRSQSAFAIQDSGVLNRMSPTQLSATVADEVKFSATTFSQSDELAGTGRRRVNLNYLVTNSLNQNKIAADLDDIGWVITGKHLLKSVSPYTGLDNTTDSGMFLDQAVGSGPMDTFGSRFYSGSTTDNDLYIKKIAANIRDYIDTDSQPTVISAPTVPAPAGLVLTESKPATGPSISQPNYQAIGKEAIPYLQEHGWRGLIESWIDTPAPVTGTLRFDHYLEFFNPYTKNFTAPTGTFLKLYDFPTWSAGTKPPLIPIDFEIDLSGIVFPAGKAVVVTTNTVNGTFADPPNLIPASSQIERKPSIPANATRYTNVQTDEVISTVKGFQLSGRSSSITDYKTRFLWGTSNGLFDSFPAVSISLGTQWNFTSRGSNVGSLTRFLYTTSMRGNDSESRSGDPRSLSEQINFLDYSSGGSSDQTRWYGNIQGHSDTGSPTIPGTATFGNAAISFVNPTASAPNNWKDYNPALADSAATAYGVIADTSMASIGELGNIYDPSRIISSVTTPVSSILYARGGARTLKIGQLDDLIPSTRFATIGATTSWFNAAWRLADLFCSEVSTQTMSLSSKPGKLNINGILRDDGVVLRAALRSFTFRPSPESDPVRNGVILSPTEIDNLITAIKTYVTNNGPLMERGEISQIPFFAGAGATNTAGGSPGSTTNDRGREEIVRRIMELITTRSNSFTVYVAGESIKQDATGKMRTQGRQTRRFTIQMDPQNAGITLNSAPMAAKVDAYKIKTVHEISY